MKKIVALIPARAGSKRVPHKNVRPLAGHPLIAYAIASALESGIFDAVVCATDSAEYADIARHYGATVPSLRPESISADTSPDIEWVKWVLDVLEARGQSFDAFSILRPTNPFRTAQTIQRAWQQFRGAKNVDSLRAVEKCAQHPGKMWILNGETMAPLIPLGPENPPWHSSQYAALPPVYVQNASLEFAWTYVVREHNSIAGRRIAPFFTENAEGVDVNSEYDWAYASWLVDTNGAALPSVSVQKMSREPSVG